MAKNKITKILSERLEELTEEKRDINYKLSDAKQAEQMGIPYPTFVKYKGNTAECPISAIVKMAKYYNVSADYLLGLVDNSAIDPKLRRFLDLTDLSKDAYHHLLIGGILKGTYKKFNVYNQRSVRIRNWIISSGYLDKITKFLNAIEKTSKGTVKECKEKGKFQSATFLMCEAANYSTIEHFDEIDKKNFLCDMNKYFLTKIVEEMANYFDHRENKGINQPLGVEYSRLRKQVKGNGNHNPTNK